MVAHFYYNIAKIWKISAGKSLSLRIWSANIVVNGRLEAIGTPSQPITVTSTPGTGGGIAIIGIGSAHLNHAVVQHAYWNIYIAPEEDAPITRIENTITQHSSSSAMFIVSSSLHLVELDNVTFANNARNRIDIEAISGPVSLAGNTTLKPHPGLEGYEMAGLNIPAGITLTLEPGVTMLMSTLADIWVNGRLEAIGTPSQPITFTSKNNSAVNEWGGFSIGGINGMGSAHLNHAVVQYAMSNLDIYLEEGVPITRIENTITQYSSSSAMSIYASSLHLVELDNVTFANNASNRIDIWDYPNPISLAGNTTLKPHPGLEGYEMAGLQIPAGITLTLEPGVTMLISTLADIWVNGRLEAIGTPAQPITFTSVTTDTLRWQGIAVNGGSAELAHATINRSRNNGLSILNGSVSASCSTLTNNLNSGIFIDENAQATVTLAYNSLAGNTRAGLRHEGPGWLDARYTWWGAADGPSGNGSGSGDAVTGNVLYEPWLTEPACHDVEFVNLEVAQIASSAVITPAETLTYTITVTNHAATTATQVVLTDTLPDNVTVLAAPAYCNGTTELVCTLADLADGAQISFTIQVQANLTETAVLTNTIKVLASQPDLDLSLNHSVLTTLVQFDVAFVNLEVTQIASSAVITPAETLTYTITVTNHAATTATQVVLTDTLPAHVTVLAAPVNCIGTTELVCTLDDLADGEQISFTIQVQANLTETAVLTNTIDVLAAESDLDLSLNHSVLTTLVQPEAPKWQIFLPMIIKPD